MSDFIDIIKQRRSIRKYQDKEIPDDMIQKILESVQWSPSWTNCQCWELIVIKDQNTKKQIKEIVGKMKNPATKAMGQAPVVLALCGKRGVSGYYKEKVSTRFDDWFMFDLGIASQNICLTAHSMGLGTVVVGLFDHEKIEKILKVPDGYDLVTLIPIGFPAKISSAPKRRKIIEFTHYDTF
ncbi:Nitroreductase [Candidatus Magnetomoraceae bacterium gMMP-1]